MKFPKIFFFILLLPIIIFITFYGCNKPEPGFGGRTSIQGQVLIMDTLTNTTKPVSGVDVLLGIKDSNPSTYTIKTTTDANGFYKFTNLQNEQEKDEIIYLQAFHSIDVKGVKQQYSTFDTVSFKNRVKKIDEETIIQKDLTLVLNPNFGDHTLGGIVIVDDILSGIQYPLPNVQVILSTDTQNNPVFQTTTISDKDGRYFFSGLKSNSYYLKSTTNIKDINYNYEAKITLNNKNQSQDISLTVSSDKGLLLIIQDKTGTPQPNLSYCLFANKSAYAGNKGCKGSFFNSKTNAFGRSFVKDVVSGATYHLKINDSIGNIKISDSTSDIKLNNTGITSLPFNLK